MQTLFYLYRKDRTAFNSLIHRLMGMLKSLHLGRGNGLPNAAVVVTSLDILYGVVPVNSRCSTTFIVKFDGVDGLKGCPWITLYTWRSVFHDPYLSITTFIWLLTSRRDILSTQNHTWSKL